MIIEANKENMNKILDVLDKNLEQALADLIGILHFVEETAREEGIKVRVKVVFDKGGKT